MVFYPRYGLILSNIQRNWFAISSDAQRARKVLQIQANSSKFKQIQANSSKVKQIQVPKKYVPPFVGKIFLLTKGRQCLNKWASPLITEILLLQSFT